MNEVTTARIHPIKLNIALLLVKILSCIIIYITVVKFMCTGLPPPPQCAAVEVTSAFSLAVSWTPPSDTSNVGGYMLTTTSQNCGTCSGTLSISFDATSVRCNNVNQACSFEVRTVAQNCGFVSNPIELHIPIQGNQFYLLTI